MNIILMILLISVLVLVHEAGHFFAAKMMKMRVDKFGIGLPFGPTLFKKQFGETELLIHACLLGGYVSFPDDEEECDLPKDSPLRFSNKPVGQRAFVIVAGVVGNFLFAYLLIILLAARWGFLPANSYTLQFSKKLDTAVEAIQSANLQKGDSFYSINGSKVVYPVIYEKYTSLSVPKDGMVSPKKVETTLQLLKDLNPELTNDEIIKSNTTVVLPERTDEEAIHLTDDQIIGFDQYKSDEKALTDEQKTMRDSFENQNSVVLEKDTTLTDIATAISDTRKPLTIVFKRGNQAITVNNIYPDKDGKLGIEIMLMENMTATKKPMDILKKSIKYVNYNIALTVYGLQKIFTGHVPLQDMKGIVAITKIGSDVISHYGMYKAIILTAIIAINLAIINILPIPVLDGGHLFFLLLEKIMGRPVSKKFSDKINLFFFYLLIALMVVLIVNDTIAIFTKQI